MISKPASFSTKIDLSLSAKLKEDLQNQGFEFTFPEYTVFAAKKKGLTCVLYKSGSLVVQGKAKNEFIEFYLEPEILKNFQYTYPAAHISMLPRIGVDEAGKGDFFGPLCIASLYADEKGIKKLISLNIKDSKKHSDKTILETANILKSNFSISVIRIFPEKYNKLYLKFKNLNFLLAWGHASAIEQLFKKTDCKKIIVDKFAHKSILENAILKKRLTLQLEQKVKAEEDIVVAAASILARASFLKGLEELSNQYNHKFPKGASKLVIEQGIKFVKTHGSDILEKVAKIHFKTKEEIINNFNP